MQHLLFAERGRGARSPCLEKASLLLLLLLGWVWFPPNNLPRDRRRLWTRLVNICTNFMLIKSRLLKQAWLLSHSYYYCLERRCYKRKGKACSLLVMVVNFHARGFLSGFSLLMMRGAVILSLFSKRPLGRCVRCVAPCMLVLSTLFKWLT